MAQSKYKDLTRFIIDFDTDTALLKAYNVGVQSTLVVLTGKPDRFREFEPGLRICGVSKFPYSILYSIRERDIMILAIKHDRRDPDYWRYRVGH